MIKNKIRKKINLSPPMIIINPSPLIIIINHSPPVIEGNKLT
jgi:hypothetical protein